VEKVILVLRANVNDPDHEQWCEQLRGPVARELLDLGLPGLTINVKDAQVRESLMTLTTLDPPVNAVVSIWTHQSYGTQVKAAITQLSEVATDVFGYLVTESIPLAPPVTEMGMRTTGLANIALLRRPVDLDEATWRHRWHVDHTPVAIETQATFGYIQNAVVRTLTQDAPALAAIVEELFPDAAVSDIKAFFGTEDDDELGRRIARMVASTAAFGANENIDTVPTSRYVWRSAFASA
jgi:EthD domain